MRYTSGFQLKFVAIVFLLGMVFGMIKISYADDTLKQEIEELKARIEQLEARMLKQDKKVEENKEINESLAKIKEAFEGLTIQAGATFMVSGTHNANADSLSHPEEDVSDGSYSVDLALEKSFQDTGKAFLHLEAGKGAGVEDELKVFSNVNRDASNSENRLELTEAYYEHYLKLIPLTLTFGKLDPTGYIDDNTYANDETTQFLGRVFRNSPVIEFPDNSGGIRLGYAPFDLVDFNFLALDGNADWEDIFDGMFYAGQLNFKPKLLGRDGNYRLLGWFNDQNHTKWLDTTKDKEKGYGFGMCFDQELTKELGIFLRYGWQNPKVYLNTASAFSLEQSYSLGGQLKGNLWGRNDDVVALAFGQIFPSDDYKKADASRRAKLENRLECYYNYRVNEHLSLSPDLQVIWNPYGKDATNGDSTIVVGGLRGQVDF